MTTATNLLPCESIFLDRVNEILTARGSHPIPSHLADLDGSLWSAIESGKMPEEYVYDRDYQHVLRRANRNA